MWNRIFGQSHVGPQLAGPSWGAPGNAGGNPSQGGGTLAPNSRAGNVAAGIEYQLVPAYPPFVRLANAPGIVYFPRFRTIQFNTAGAVAGNVGQLTYFFSCPTIVIARTAAAHTTTNAALPVGRDSLDCFAAQFTRQGAASDAIDAGGGGQNPAVLVTGSAILGSARQPALIQGNGLFFDTSYQLTVEVETFVDALQVDITIWCIEEFGPGRG